jgi:hypothetical protein
MGEMARDAFPPTGGAGTDVATLIADLFDRGKRDRVVLSCSEGLYCTANSNHYVARAATSAANDWTVDRWLGRDPRLFGLILVSAAMPEQAAEEIRRLASVDQMVGVALGVNALSQPFGHPIYHPIYRAAAEASLPIVLQVGCDSPANLLTLPVAGGLPTTFGEYKAMIAQPAMSHLGSLILQGVFEMFPALRILVVGAGVSWIPGFLWRHDYYYKIEADAAPWLQRAPSEYFRSNIRVATYPLEKPREPSRLGDALMTVPWLDEVLMYASGYPAYDWQDLDTIADRVPSEWMERVERTNALKFYRWPGRAARSAGEEAI